MTINLVAENTTSRETGKRRRLLTVTGVVGVGYSLSWIAGLSVPAPNPGLGASGAQVAAVFAGHGPALAMQFALTEGLPAAGIAVIAVALARTAATQAATKAGRGARAARVVLAAGLTAAIISALQFALGLVLTATTAPGAAHVLYVSVNRLDGVKMLALAVLGAAAAATGALPRWLSITGIALAVSITFSSLVYLLLLPGLAVAAGPALVLLMLFITGCGIMIGMTDSSSGPKDR